MFKQISRSPRVKKIKNGIYSLDIASIGGILMTDSTRLIIVKNTLDCRIDLCI